MPIRIPLSQGKFALVSNVDAPRVLAHKWSHQGGNYACRSFYVVLPDGRKVRRKELLHRFVMRATPDQEIDHKDGNGLNCMRSNLRRATRAQNVANTGPRKGSKCRYKGVYYRPDRDTWSAEITVNGKHKRLGCYKTPEAAAFAYDLHAYAAWGEFAYLNLAHNKPLYQFLVTTDAVWRNRPACVAQRLPT